MRLKEELRKEEIKLEVKRFIGMLGTEFFTGVPDSRLKPLCNYLLYTYGISEKHIIAANEGNSVAIAAGYYLATGKIPLVYLQNSGIGNIINPVCSLISDRVYGIPCIFVVGWRGEPGTEDEPQHTFQGEITLKLLKDIGIDAFVIDGLTSETELANAMKEYKKILKRGRSIAFVIKKGGLKYSELLAYQNNNSISREEAIRHITEIASEDIIVSSTGKISRELFENREKNNETHSRDFLTVGSMGHSSSIALGIAMTQKKKKIWCIDGDGSALMHLGAMAVIGSTEVQNLIHIIINNEAHDTVGGQPTVMKSVNIVQIANACKYKSSVSVSNYKELDYELSEAKKRNALSLIEVKCAMGGRESLGRPTLTTSEIKEHFMEALAKE